MPATSLALHIICPTTFLSITTSDFLLKCFKAIYGHGDAVIGRNLKITHGTLLGMTNRREQPGASIVGDHVFFGAGALATGNIHIGDDAVDGAHAWHADH